MQTRKVVVSAAIAALAVAGVGSAVSANVIDTATGATDLTNKTSDIAPDVAPATNGGGTKWYWAKDNGSLVAIDDNNVGPFQACHNNGAGNVIGGAAAGSDIIGIVGWDNDGNTATVVKTCEQDSTQVNDQPRKVHGKWYKADENGIVSVSNNNVGPFQACHNNVSINGVGGAGTISDLTAILGWDNDDNHTDVMKTCEQDSKQHN